MRVLIPGHRYEAEHLDGREVQVIQFVDRGHGNDTEGTTCQELIKILIDRVKFLDKEVPSAFNEEILYHARIMLINFEARALTRKVEKKKILPEELTFSDEDRHILLSFKQN